MPTIMIHGEKRQYDKGTPYERIAAEYQAQYKAPIALVIMNGKLRELFKKVDRDGVLSFVTTADAAGYKTYARTAQMMLIKAVDEEARRENAKVCVKIEFSLGNACYCSLRGAEATPEYAQRIQAQMEELRDKALPITKKSYPIDDAIGLFHRQEMHDKEKLFHFRRSSAINVYCLEGLYDYFYGYMLPRTDYVQRFAVQPYRGGMLLVLPSQERPDRLEPFVEQPSLFEQLMLSTQWGELVGITTAGDLNERICQGHISDMILVQEALQERRIGEIAQQIHARGSVKFVLVAGPSSSGKTTFAHRLSVQLRSFGLRPHIISLDDYFVNRERTPVDIDGNYNYDCLEAIDLELFNDDMNDLLSGETVEMPTFDFKAGKRIYKGNTMKLAAEDVLVIEGIHGLNPLTTKNLPDENKFKVYISALTSLNIDEHNRIPSTDARLIRRMVRDARTRGTDAQESIGRWRSVREGEEQYIFPFQEQADAVFNSVLIYELAVLKQFAEPLLFNVQQGEPEYYEAKRLLKFLEYFVGVDTAAVPTNSLCREFVGGGCFPV